jgi:hypothetical protein
MLPWTYLGRMPEPQPDLAALAALPVLAAEVGQEDQAAQAEPCLAEPAGRRAEARVAAAGLPARAQPDRIQPRSASQAPW